MLEGEIVVNLSPMSTKYHHWKTEVDNLFKPMLYHITQHFIYSSVITGELVNHCSQFGGGFSRNHLLTFLGLCLTSPTFFVSIGYFWCKDNYFCYDGGFLDMNDYDLVFLLFSSSDSDHFFVYGHNQNIVCPKNPLLSPTFGGDFCAS